MEVKNAKVEEYNVAKVIGDGKVLIYEILVEDEEQLITAVIDFNDLEKLLAITGTREGDPTLLQHRVRLEIDDWLVHRIGHILEDKWYPEREK